jgi:two-component system, cell cycle response regulator DivK
MLMADELILVVEDNDKNLKLVRDLLQVKRFRVLEARTAEQGLALAAEHRPHLILMDIQLPDLDGTTALGRLRSGSRTTAIPVVALTAFAMKEERERFLSAGFDGYLAKPIDIRTFPDQVRAFIEHGEAVAQRRIEPDQP